MSDWRRGRLGELATGHRGVTYADGQLCEFQSAATATLLRSNNISRGQLNFDSVQIVPARLVSDKQFLYSGDIAVCMSNGSKALVGKAAPFVKSSSARFTVGAFCSVFRPTESVDPAFVAHIFQSQGYRNNLDLALAGTAINNLRNSDVENFECGIPPIREQTRIAKILDTLDTAIHETEALIAKLKAVKQGLLHDLLTRGIDANGELRPHQAEAPQLYKESALGWIPKEWDFSPLVSKIDFPAGQVDPRLAPYRDWVLVAPDHIESGTGRLLTTATADEQQAISGKYVFEAGDVIYSKIRPYLRKATLASNSGLCSADMYPLRPKAGIESRYLLAVVLGDQFSRFSESVSMRSGFPKINRSEMAEFSIGWPCPEEQVRIAQLLCESDSTQRIEEHQRDKLELLKSGLMDDLLTGHVRVTPLLNSADPLVQPPAALIRQQTVGQMGGCDA
jgi:type I restriction enzyme S subunit